MKATYRFISVDGTETTHSVDLLDEPGHRHTKLHEIFELHFGPDIEMEHVNVWYDDHYTDMFVDETGSWKGLPINKTATDIYRANVLAHAVNPPNPEDMPPIFGDAILFEKKVWF